ncbi:signal transduction histidine kinase/DNA-binding response OmpR family regulator/ligand-binding sensor domain-containing protein [Dysgonomonas hofstadii]|uniref:histidine kinase n=1 Tax=Dysgonomonas hofstadii TaxID=637886 RepID=A0A840CLE1_9BACT|nr:hybrid sensor histidine kinase/response regulator transcription factor [Dysgonomonas hofstadii]MBB4034244.1 signal transduction histidine kinase/DNA-binding response OmpR family regulator/ligand-binding sensor domain-containing protein [Dysgonomonas hofstadii]
MRFIIALFLGFMSILSANSQIDYKFRTLSPGGGFYYDGVSRIEQDKEGFIWVLMANELYRFDGYQYKRYHSYFKEMEDSVRWSFVNMASDSKGNFYVNTNNGLFIYDGIQDKFDKIFNPVDHVRVDGRDSVWIKVDNRWSLLDTKSGNLTTPLYDGESLSMIGNIFCTHGDDLYLFSNYSRIYRFNYIKKEFHLCSNMPYADGVISYARAYKGKLWVLKHKYGLFKIDLSTFAIEERFDLFNGDNATQVRTFFIDKNGCIWVGSLSGLDIFDPDKKMWTQFTHSETDFFSLPNNSVWAINEDRQKNIWIGTYSGLLSYVNLDEKKAFKTYTPRKNQLSHIPVSAFAEDDNFIWVGTEGGGINQISKTTGEFSYYKSTLGSKKITFDNIKSMVVDKDKNLWIAMYTGGLDCYNTKTNQVRNFRSRKDSNSLLNNNIRKIIKDGDLGLWIIYQQQKTIISFYSFKDNLFYHYDIDGENETRYLFDILRSGEDQLWTITNKKLYRMNTRDHSVDVMQQKDSTFMDFNTFCLDDSGNIWIGTIGNGLVRYNPSKSEFTLFSEILKYNIYSIFNICYDDEGNLWMGTDNGLIRYNIKKDHYSKYDKGDGVQGQVYYPLAAMKGLNGDLYFGGTNGFTIVNPKNIPHNTYKPKVIISELLIDHKPSKLNFIPNDSLGLKNELVLNYSQANFGFRFSSDNYLIPEKNHYKYRLRGYDDRWIEVNASNRVALYSKVPAGTYYFEVLAANNDGVWSDHPTIIKIIRKPALWLSWPAYILYTIIICGIIFMILRYYYEKKKLKNQLYLENLEKEKKEQIHQAQLRFFTNISHDFRTPLSLILAALGRLRQEGLKEYYYRILNSNAQRLLNLINELMDFRTVENGKMKLAIEAFNVNEYVEKLALDFTDYAKQHNITFNIIKDKGMPREVYADKHLIEKIVMNLLNNAFKYTKEGGTISIEILSNSDVFSSRYENQYTVKNEELLVSPFSIVVRDSGVGISKESISNVFERFYKVNTVNTDSHLGTGIGLALVKSIVLLHKGTISIYSERDKGTDMEVRLPLDKSVYEDSEFLVKVDDIESIDTNPIEDNDLEEEGGLVEEETVLLRDKKRVLLAEDNNDLRILLAGALSDNYEVIEAADGLIAEEFINEMEIDLIISDIMMPFKDGVTLCREVKNDIKTSHIPFILLTAKNSVESKIEGAGSGADIYLEKPIDISFLILSVQNIFKHQQQLKEYYAKNYFVDSAELSTNEHDNKFLKKFVEIIEANIDQSEMDVNYIASQLLMSRSKLYTKIKSLTDKSIVEFILSHRMRKAARMIIEEDLTMREIMAHVGIESQSYFTNAFKKEFGETPTAFAAKHRKKNK